MEEQKEISESEKPEKSELETKTEEVADSKQKTDMLIADVEVKNAQERLAELSKLNDMIEKETLRHEMLKAKAQLGGSTIAGQRQPSAKEKAQEEAAKLLSGFQ